MFASRWLPAWTGGDADRLLAFYEEDAEYSDPAARGGLKGHGEIRPYFERLLGRYPDWVWTQTAATPMEGGFLNHWRATLPADGGRGDIVFEGACTVRFGGSGRIAANHVYFDPSPLTSA